MSERTVLICDVCGAPSTTTVSFKANGASYQKDLCAKHVAELVKGARTPKRGRRPGSTSSTHAPPKRRGRPPKVAAARSAPSARRASASRSTDVKDSHDRYAVASRKSAAGKRPRKKITDPVVPEQRRAALVKARQARADKLAAVAKPASSWRPR